MRNGRIWTKKLQQALLFKTTLIFTNRYKWFQWSTLKYTFKLITLIGSIFSTLWILLWFISKVTYQVYIYSCYILDSWTPPILHLHFPWNNYRHIWTATNSGWCSPCSLLQLLHICIQCYTGKKPKLGGF